MSLFARILAWFLAATLLIAATAVILHVTSGEPLAATRLAVTVLQAAVDEAASRHAEGGDTALRVFLAEWERDGGPALRIADAAGRELLGGEDLGPLLARARRFDSETNFRAAPPVLAVRSAQGGVQAVIDLRPKILRDGVARWENLAVLGLAVMLCWVLAAHISRPIGALRDTVERFGAGATDLRIASGRADEIGGLERAYNGMAERIQGLIEAQRQVLLDISHEIRSPLSRLTLASSLLREDPRDTECLDQIEKEAARINELVSEVLSLARGDELAGAGEYQQIDLRVLAIAVIDATRLEAEAADVRVALTADESAPVEGSPEQLRRALENVVRNAIRHAPRESTVDVSVNAGAEGAVVEIRDRGPGVPAAALPRLFDPFFQVDGSRTPRPGSAGLGLAIARRAVESAHGTITARNADPGLLVRIVLPAADS